MKRTLRVTGLEVDAYQKDQCSIQFDSATGDVSVRVYLRVPLKEAPLYTLGDEYELRLTPVETVPGEDEVTR